MSYPPELYAAVHRGHAGDAQFYRRLAQGGRSVLELGAGYGRIGEALTAAGARYLGLELSPELIRYGRERWVERGAAGEPPRVIQGDMTCFSLEERFDCVIIPFTGFYCLTSLAVQVACLERVHAHLVPGGVFAFDAYCADAMHEEADDAGGEPSDPEFVVTVDIQGACYDVFESSVWDRAAQTIEARYFYEARDGSRFERGTIPQRYLLRAEVEPLLRAAGFRDVRVHGGFRGEPFDPEGDLLVVQAVR